MRTLRTILLAVILAGYATMAVAAGGEPLKLKPGALEKFKLSASVSPEEQKYLGISGKGPFMLSQIKAEIVIVEFFSMYCPYCQAEAPIVNRLFELISKSPDLENKVKMVGIGIGNTPFEVGVFRKKYKVQFPLIPDEDYTSDKMASKRFRTPTFITFGRAKRSTIKVIDIHPGKLGNPEQFLERVTRSMAR